MTIVTDEGSINSSTEYAEKFFKDELKPRTEPTCEYANIKEEGTVEGALKAARAIIGRLSRDQMLKRRLEHIIFNKHFEKQKKNEENKKKEYKTLTKISLLTAASILTFYFAQYKNVKQEITNLDQPPQIVQEQQLQKQKQELEKILGQQNTILHQMRNQPEKTENPSLLNAISEFTSYQSEYMTNLANVENQLLLLEPQTKQYHEIRTELENQKITLINKMLIIPLSAYIILFNTTKRLIRQRYRRKNEEETNQRIKEIEYTFELKEIEERLDRIRREEARKQQPTKPTYGPLNPEEMRKELQKQGIKQGGGFHTGQQDTQNADEPPGASLEEISKYGRKGIITSGWEV